KKARTRWRRFPVEQAELIMERGGALRITPLHSSESTGLSNHGLLSHAAKEFTPPPSLALFVFSFIPTACAVGWKNTAGFAGCTPGPQLPIPGPVLSGRAVQQFPVAGALGIARAPGRPIPNQSQFQPGSLARNRPGP